MDSPLPAEPVPDSSSRQLGLWRHADFIRLWIGQTVSDVGSQVTLLALPLTAILVFKASAFQVGALATVEYLPFILFGLPVGVWVDRLSRRPVLIAADVVRLAVIGSIPLAYAIGVLRLPQLYVVAFLSGIGTTFFQTAYTAYLPSLIERERLVEGNAKLEGSRSGAQMAGPGLGGVLVQALSAPGALLADAGSYLASVVSLVAIRTREPRVDVPEGGHPPLRRQIGEGIRFVLAQPLLRPLLACTAILNLFHLVGESILVLFAVRRLGLSAGEIGVILSIGGLSFIIGALVAGRLGRTIGIGPTLIAAASLFGVGGVLVALARPATAWPLLIGAGLVWSFGGVVYNVNGRSLVQTMTPDRILGRTVATNRFVVWGVMPIGAFLGGLLGSRIGLRPTLWISAAGQALAFVPPLLSPVRRLSNVSGLPDS